MLETLNPACWVAFFESYIRDITHVWPLHPETLKYLVLASGFTRADLEYRSPVAAPRSPADDRAPASERRRTAATWRSRRNLQRERREAQRPPVHAPRLRRDWGALTRSPQVTPLREVGSEGWLRRWPPACSSRSCTLSRLVEGTRSSSSRLLFALGPFAARRPRRRAAGGRRSSRPSRPGWDVDGTRRSPGPKRSSSLSAPATARARRRRPASGSSSTCRWGSPVSCWCRRRRVAGRALPRRGVAVRRTTDADRALATHDPRLLHTPRQR